MLKHLTALLAALSLAVPATAKVDNGTIELIQTLEEYGVTMLYNTAACSEGFAGRYTTQRQLTVCYRGTPRADAYDTIRHEATHFVQHCAALRRGRNRILPIAANNVTRNQWVKSILDTSIIDHVIDSYPQHHHQVELEAFASAAHYSAKDLTALIQQWCRK